MQRKSIFFAKLTDPSSVHFALDALAIRPIAPLAALFFTFFHLPKSIPP